MKIPKNFPTCCMGGYDPLQHKTEEDLRALVLHEIDLYEEDEESEIKTPAQYKECKYFIGWGKK